MKSRNRTLRTLAVVALALVGVAAIFAVFEGTYRAFETNVAVELLRALHGPGVSRFTAATVLVEPRGQTPFQVVVAPSCSAFASLCSFACVAPLTRRFGTSRRLAAFAAAATTVAVGNVIRIAASIWMGLVAGRASLVLFHDWVGSAFGFAYTLFGFVLMLVVLLPRDRGERIPEVIGPGSVHLAA